MRSTIKKGARVKSLRVSESRRVASAARLAAGLQEAPLGEPQGLFPQEQQALAAEGLALLGFGCASSGQMQAAWTNRGLCK